jgi:MFS transporter, DHA1 family, multidrug resistance protein
VRGTPAWLRCSPVVVDYLLSHLGFFAVLPVLPLLLTSLQAGLGAVWVGAMLLAFNFAVRGGSLFCNRILNDVPARAAMAGGLLAASAGFTLLAVAHGPIGLLCCLLLAGFGVSVNGLAARAYVTMVVPEKGGRASVFAAIQVAANISAAIGPVIADFLFSEHHQVLLLRLIAGTYALAAVFVAIAIRAGLRPRDASSRRPQLAGLLATIATDSDVRRVSLVTFTGSFLYGQFFSAFVLDVSEITTSAALRASFFTMNAIAVVVLQVPATRHIRRGLDRSMPTLRYLLLGTMTFSAACLIFGISGSLVAGAFAGVAVFSLAETYFSPGVNIAYGEIAAHRPVVEAFNLRQVAVSVGESLGSFCGGALFLPVAARGLRPEYWIVLAILGAALSCASLRYAVPARKVQINV